MPKYLAKSQKMIHCENCEWDFIPELRDYSWHQKNCGYMADMKKRLRVSRKNELKYERAYYKKIMKEK